MTLTKVTNRMLGNPYTGVKDFGASSSASAAANLAAFNAAINATPVGGTLYIPAEPSAYVIDTSGGRSGCILVNKEITLFIDGTISGSTGTIEANPQAIFNVSADNVTFTGNGIIKGDGTINQQNAGTQATIPSLIYVSGDYFTFSNMTIQTPPKVGLHIVSGSHAKITNCNFTGGPTSYEDTGYFAIRFDGGGKHIVSNNQFYPDSLGGMFVNTIFAVCDDCIYDNNICHKPYEKLVYITGDGNIVSNNIVIGNPSTIAGTNLKGTIGAVYRCDGGNNKVTGNFSQYGGGIACRFEGGNLVSDNTCIDAGQSGCVIFQGTSVLDFTSVKNNTFICGDLTGFIIQEGISIAAETGANYQIDVSNNTVEGFGLNSANRHANIQTWQATQTITASLQYIVIPTSINNFYYIPQNAGTTGSLEPTWPTVAGNTVTDGTVVWKAVAYSTTNIGAISVSAPSSKFSYSNVSNNIINEADIGILTTYMDNSVVQNNLIRAGNWGIIQSNGTNNRFRYNIVKDATNIGIGSLDATSSGEGNSYNNGGIFATVTLTASVATMNVSTSTLLAATSGCGFMISPNNDAAADFIRDHGIYCTRSGSTVSINSASGTNFVGTEQVNIQLIQ